MSSQSAHAAFHRALQARVWVVAWSAAAELETVAIDAALDLLFLTLDDAPTKYARASDRWTERFTMEARLHITESALVAAALAALPGPGARAGLIALDVLAQSHRFEEVRIVVHRRIEGARRRG